MVPVVPEIFASGFPPRFLCDEMLGHVCRYLRAAGYDTLFANSGCRDRELLLQCQVEGRYFLTQDRLISEHSAARGIALILPQENLDRLAILLGEHFHLDWVARAFTRCLEDNALLHPADAEARKGVPQDVLKPGASLTCCPVCGKVYWQGSHCRRIYARLSRWQAEQADP